MPQRRDNVAENPNWFPWADREVRLNTSYPILLTQHPQTCVLDVLCHLPHSLFSDAQMDIIRWGMEMFGINNLPSSAVMKKIDEVLQLSCGIDTIRYRGPFGHTYYVNHLSSIISQVDCLSSTSREKLTVISQQRRVTVVILFTNMIAPVYLCIPFCCQCQLVQTFASDSLPDPCQIIGVSR